MKTNKATNKWMRRISAAAGVMLMAAQSWAAAGVTATATLSPAAPFYSDTVTVTVSLVGTGAAQPTGSISYHVDSGTTTTAALKQGTASSLAYLMLAPQTPGMHTLTYTYGGDGTYAAGTAQVLNYTVTDHPLALNGGQYQLGALQSSTNKAQPNNLGVTGVAVDAKLNVYLSYGTTSFYTATPAITKIDINQLLSTVPVTGIGAYTQLVTDPAGNLYIADRANARVLEYSTAGVQTVLGLTGLSAPAAITFDRSTNSLYLADTGTNNLIRFNLTTNVQTTVATGLTGLGNALSSDGAGGLYYVTSGNVFYLTGGGTTAILGEFNGSANGVVYDPLTGALWVSYGGPTTTNAIRVDKAGHATYLATQLRNTQLAVSNASEVYSGDWVMCAGPAYDGGPGTALNLQGFANGNDYAWFSMPYGRMISGTYNQPATTGTQGSANVIQAGGAQNFGIGAAQYPLKITLDNNATLTVPVYGNGFGPYMAMQQGLVAPLAGAYSNMGGIAYTSPAAGYDIYTYVSDTAANTVTATDFAFQNGYGAGSNFGPQVFSRTTLGFTGLVKPTQLAVDGARDVYVLDGGSTGGAARILRLDYAGNQTTIYTASAGDPANLLASVKGFALDGATNVYLAGTNSSGKGTIVRMDPAGNEVQLTNSTGVPVLVAIDGVRNVFWMDTAGTLSKADVSGAVTVIATGLGTATSLSLDASDTAYITTASGTTVTSISLGA